jgi:hypothetical protein
VPLVGGKNASLGELYRKSRRISPVMVTLAGIAVMITAVLGQPAAPPSSVAIPENATALEGVPHVRIETTRDSVTRRELDAAEAATNRLMIRIDDGRFYWTSREDRPLTVTSSDEFTYLLSSHPGKYVRFKRLSDKLAYVEHVDMAFGSVTYWGELRIVIGK